MRFECKVEDSDPFYPRWRHSLCSNSNYHIYVCVCVWDFITGTYSEKCVINWFCHSMNTECTYTLRLYLTQQSTADCNTIKVFNCAVESLATEREISRLIYHLAEDNLIRSHFLPVFSVFFIFVRYLWHHLMVAQDTSGLQPCSISMLKKVLGLNGNHLHFFQQTFE